MKPVKGYNEAVASGSYTRLPAGGYIIKITSVTDQDDKQYLKIIFDIAEGPEKDRFKDEQYESRHAFVRSYKESALGMFKAFIKAVDATNGTDFDSRIEKGFPEKELVGKCLGVVIGYEEYISDRGETKERLRIARCCPDTVIRERNFKVPELKKLTEKPGTSAPISGFTAIPDGDLPF